jgi:hypothetical protein
MQKYVNFWSFSTIPYSFAGRIGRPLMPASPHMPHKTSKMLYQIMKSTDKTIC